MTNINRIITKSVKEFGLPVFNLKLTQEDARQNSQTPAAFNGNLGSEMEAQKGNPLDYGS